MGLSGNEREPSRDLHGWTVGILICAVLTAMIVIDFSPAARESVPSAYAQGSGIGIKTFSCVIRDDDPGEIASCITDAAEKAQVWLQGSGVRVVEFRTDVSVSSDANTTPAGRDWTVYVITILYNDF